jgi:hypothetical protein
MYQEQFGPIFRTWNGRKPRVLLNRPEDVEVRGSREILVFTFIISVFISYFSLLSPYVGGGGEI